MKVSSYYHRDYSNDYSESKETSINKRVFLAALPFLSLYKPAGFFLSISLNSLRSATSFNIAHSNYQEKNNFKAAGYFLISTVSVISVANCFFNHQTALFITTFSDIFENLLTMFQHFSNKELLDGVCSLIEIANSSIYFKVLAAPTIEILLISYILQIILELIQSAREFRKEDSNGEKKYIEGGAKLLMAVVRGAQASPYAEAFLTKHSDIISQRRERIAKVFHDFAATLASPFWWYTEKGVRIFSPIRPDKPDQCSTRTLEIISRIFYASLAIPIAPISVGFAVIELIPRILANVIQPRPFFHLKGEAAEKNDHTNSYFKVFTENLCAVAGGFSRLFGGVTNWKHRIDEIVIKILEKDPDVICLQEINDINAAKALYERLKGKYAHFYFNVGSKIFSQNSGHFIASKYSVNEISMSFLPFNSGKGLQAMVNKGLFSFALECKNQVFAHIFAVHLSPSKKDLKPTEKETSTRSREMQVVMNQIRATSKKYPHSAILFLGDMNLRWGSEEWKSSPIPQEFQDPYNEHRSDVSIEDSTCCTDEIIRAFHRGKSQSWHTNPMIVDHALLLKNKEWEAQASLVKFFDPDQDPYDALSDHNGLLMEISLPVQED